MTVIVGIRCQDAVVLGADSQVSYQTRLLQPTIKQHDEKLYVIGENAVLGVSGSVSLGQRYNSELTGRVKGSGNRMKYKDVPTAMRDLAKALWKHAGDSWERAGVTAKTIGEARAHLEVAHDTLIALPVQDEPCLLGFSQQCEGTEYSTNMPIVSIGSGQPVADPFLAFIRRIFWPHTPPTLSEGILAVVWALRHTIESQPGGVGDPIQVATLSKDRRGQWKAQELADADMGEPRQNINALEDEMRKAAREFFSEEPTAPIPEKPS
jgi:20S proteasome alpha/beta subunit